MHFFVLSEVLSKQYFKEISHYHFNDINLQANFNQTWQKLKNNTLANSTESYFSPIIILNVSYLYRISQRNSDSKWKTLRDSNHKYSNTNNEEFNKILNIDRSALR